MIHIYVGIASQVASLLVGLAIVPLHYHACLAIVEQAKSAIAPIRPVAVGIHLLVLADVVHLCIHGGTATVGEVRGKYLAHISLVSTTAKVHICHPLRLVLLLDGQVHHRGLVRIQFPAVFLLLVRLIVYLHVLHGIGGHIGQGGVHIAKERLAVHQNLVHHLALIGHIAVLVYAYAGQLVHQRCQRRIRRQAQGSTAEQERVLLHSHHARQGRNVHLVQFLGGGLHAYVHCCRRALCRQRHIAHEGCEAHHSGHHNVFSICLSLQQELSLLIGVGSSNTRGVLAKQLNTYLRQHLLSVSLYDSATDLILLCHSTKSTEGKQDG